MTDAQKAAFRLLATTPAEKIHRHQWQPAGISRGYKYTAEQVAALTKELRELEQCGVTRKQMGQMRGCDQKTIRRYLGKRRRR